MWPGVDKFLRFVAYALLMALLCLHSDATWADNPDIVLGDTSFHGLLDLRLQYSAAQPGELENGLGKFRNGGDNSRLLVNQAALTVQSRLGWDWSGTLTAKYANQQNIPLDLTEAFLAYRPVSTSAWHFSSRVGIFFPPISLKKYRHGLDESLHLVILSH